MLGHWASRVPCFGEQGQPSRPLPGSRIKAVHRHVCTGAHILPITPSHALLAPVQIGLCSPSPEQGLAFRYASVCNELPCVLCTSFTEGQQRHDAWLCKTPPLQNDFIFLVNRKEAC